MKDKKEKKEQKMFDLPPKCPALAGKLSGLFGWRQTYQVHQKQKGIPHSLSYNLQKSYSLNLPPKKVETKELHRNSAGMNPDSWVVVHHLQSQSGILDPDDHVSDVADDREQILASYDDCPGPDPTVPQGGGDGASGSSVGTSSPDIFRTTTDGKYGQHNESVATHIDVTASDQPPNGLTLQVRRGSEPSLLHCDLDQNSNQLYNNNQSSQEPSKRWSAAPVCRSDSEPPERLLTGSANSNYLSPKWSVPEEESHNDSLPSFSRSGRLSMQFLGDGAGYRWMEAADKAILNQPTTYNSKSLPRDAKRKEPLGQANHENTKHKIDEMLLIVNENGGPLGLTAIPDQENGGLLVQSVEPGSRAERGRLRRADRILEINGVHLVGLSENSVQDHLRKCIGAAELRLRVLRADVKPANEIYAADERQGGGKVNGQNVSPTRKMPGATGGSSLQAANTRKLGRRHDITLKKGPQGLGFSVTTRDNPAGGHCPIYIKNILPKGAAVEDGRLKPGDRLLEVDGHTMTGKSQTEVVNILRATQLGATVKIVVSRQNELVEIDERDIDYGTVTPKPPPPVLPAKSVLKSPSAPSIRDCIEKQPKENLFSKDDPANTSTNVRMRIKKFSGTNGSETSANGSTVFPWRNREVLTLHIPVHDTEKAGLGVSVKGKTGSSTPNSSISHNTSFSSKHHDGDLGIFVKSVLHGGAASRDGRLKMNDQLLSVNSISLLGQSNAEAMDTLRRAMFHTGGKYPGIITLGVARRAGSRPNSTIEPTENGVEQEEQTGSTVVYLTPNDKAELNSIHGGSKRYSNPVLDRLTGGTVMNNSMRAAQAAQAAANGLRNDSYYMATNEMWSPAPHMNLNGSNAVLIEEDPSEPASPALPLRNDPMQQIATSTPNGDITYASQLSLEHPNNEAFSRDAVGRRSMSEKHHAALDARETGTYQRNKKLRQEREQDKKGGKLNSSGGSMESLTNVQNRIGSMKNKRSDLRAEALDRVGELGPSLGMKKSSSLESLQTMVQEIQMSDEPRGPNALRTPRGRGREEVLRAAVERGPDAQPRKHWLLEDGMTDQDGGFPNRGPFQSSLNDGKNKNRQKKQGGLLKGIGHMFRFGKHRKDVFPAPTEVISDYGGWSANDSTLKPGSPATLPANPSSQPREQREVSVGPPMYQPPPAVGPLGNGVVPSNGSAVNSKINQNDAFNHRYSHYVNYDELQMQLRNKLIVSKMKQRAPQRPQSQIVTSKAAADLLSESLIERMREQVRVQRAKVDEESRRNQHYHSQRSARNVDMSHYQQYTGQTINGMNNHKYQQQLQQQQQRPISSFYEYETINTGSYRKIADHAGAKWPPSQPTHKNGGNQLIVSGTSSVRTHRGPFVTQVHIRDQNGHQPSASKV